MTIKIDNYRQFENIFCLSWKNALSALATHNKMMYSKTANEMNGANKLGDLHTMQQSNKAMFFKTSRTRPREFYRFTALMHSSLTQILTIVLTNILFPLSYESLSFTGL